MLSERSLKAIAKLLKHLCFLKIIPFDWDPTSFSVKVIRDRRIYITLFVTLVLISHCFYLAISQLNVTMEPSERSVHMIWQTAFILGSVTSYNSFSRRHELSIFINHFFEFNRFLKGKLL